jgi:hypothetical protein
MNHVSGLVTFCLQRYFEVFNVNLQLYLLSSGASLAESPQVFQYIGNWNKEIGELIVPVSSATFEDLKDLRTQLPKFRPLMEHCKMQISSMTEPVA